MTYEEAIEQLSYVDGCNLVNDEYLYKGISKATEALEKQIPMRPIAGHPRDFICGKCHQTVVGSGNYCWFCGQAIDWSEEK